LGDTFRNYTVDSSLESWPIDFGPSNWPAGGSPSWLLGQDIDDDFDFLKNRAKQANIVGTATSFLTATRGGAVSYAENLAGLYFQFNPNTFRMTDKGILVEDGCTNVVSWNRDLTNAAWVQTSITSIKNQTGIDGAANAASSITASAANATILQNITNASQDRWTTAFVKRLVGSGVINMTVNGGTTWTPITVTAGWTRVSIPKVTASVNPSVGFQIVTSGDSIAVDFVQVEHISSGVYSIPFATSPIWVTTGTATRNADTVTFNTMPAVSTTNFSMYLDGMFYAQGATASTFPGYLTFVGSTPSADGLVFGTNIQNQFVPLGGALIGGTGTNNGTPNAPMTLNTPWAAAYAFSPTRTIACSNGILGTVSNNQPLGSNSPAGATAQMVQAGLSLPEHFQQVGFAWIRRAGIWRTKTLPDSRLQTLTSTPL